MSSSAPPPVSEPLANPGVAHSDGRYALLGWVLAVGIVLDQVTKQVANAYLRDVPPVIVIQDFFQFRYARNKGAFFSIGGGLDDGLRIGMFVTVTLIAVVLIWRMYRQPDARGKFRLGLALLLAGAVGNLIDRVLYGEVIDFLHLHFADHFHWATFNVADMAITFGVALMLWGSFRGQDRPPPEPAEV